MTTTSKEKKTTSFDVNKYTVSTDTKTETVKIGDTGDSFEISIKQLSWARRNQLISKHLNWTADGDTSFNGDGYVRDCLKDMIVDAPWGKTTETFLNSIDDRLGNALEGIVPKAFSSDSAVQRDTVKKES